MKTAILQVADTGPLESLVVMLRSAGYECKLVDDRLQGELRALGCDNVTTIRGLVENWGYEQPFPLPTAEPDDMHDADLYVDVKAHRNGPRVIARWPELRGRVLWYRINGTEPEHVINQNGDHGDEVNLEFPVLTPNLWYRSCPSTNKQCKPGTPRGANWGGMAYPCWPPYVRFDEHPPRNQAPFTAPLCLVHNVAGWGFGPVCDAFRALGIAVHGRGSPDGLLPHRDALARLRSALCMVHMKSSDSPGYALYESVAAGCPVVCSRRLPWRNRMEELFEDGVTCLMYDVAHHGPHDVAECEREVRGHLVRLADPRENARIARNARERLSELMWSDGDPVDAAGFAAFMVRHFGR